MFDYDPNDANSHWPAGRYAARLDSAIEGKSKSTNEAMLTLTFAVKDTDGRRQTVKDYVVKKTTFKLAALAEALGESEAFRSKTFDATDYLGRIIAVSLGVDRGRDGTSKPRNNIVAYLQPSGEGEEQDVPF